MKENKEEEEFLSRAHVHELRTMVPEASWLAALSIYGRKRLIKTGVEKALQSRQIKIFTGLSSIDLPWYNKHKTCERKIVFVKFSLWTQQCCFHKCIPRDNLKHVCGLYVRILICSGTYEEKYQSNTYGQQDYTNGQYIIDQIAVRFNIECSCDGKKHSKYIVEKNLKVCIRISLHLWFRWPSRLGILSFACHSLKTGQSLQRLCSMKSLRGPASFCLVALHCLLPVHLSCHIRLWSCRRPPCLCVPALLSPVSF